MASAPFTSRQPQSALLQSRWTRPSLASFLPIPVLLSTMAIARAVVEPWVYYEPAWLVVLGNVLGMTLLGLAVSYVAARSYRATGQFQILLLGCGVLVFGIAGGLAALARAWPGGANLNVTIHNTGALLAGVFHLVAAFLLLAGLSPETRPTRRLGRLILGYSIPTILVAVSAMASYRGLLPRFFIQGLGATPIHRGALALANHLFLLSFIILLGSYLRARETFLYWYACALALSCVSLTAFSLQHAVGSPVCWIGRLAQYLGGVCFLISMLTAARTAQTRRITLNAVLRCSLSGAEERFRALAENSPDAIRRFDRELNLLYVNSAGQRLHGRAAGAVVGKRVEETSAPHSQIEVLRNAVQGVFDSGSPVEVEQRFPVDGEMRSFESRCVAERGPAGEVANVLVVTRDITERKRAEAELAADLDALARMHRLSGRVVEVGSIQALLQETMDTAVALMGASKGTLQLCEGGRLRMVAHRGHERPFLDFFVAPDNVASVCGEATRRGTRIVVPDVENSPLLAGTPSLPVLRAAGVRAVQSTPMHTRSGRLLGVLTTHWSAPHGPDERSLWRLDLLVRQAADLIEQKRSEEALRRSEARQMLLSDTSARLMAADNPQSVIEDLCRRLMAHLDCQMFFNYLVDPKANRLHLNAHAGIPSDEVRRIEWLEYGSAICGCAARDRQRIVAVGIQGSSDPRTDLVRSYGIQAFCCHPLLAGGRLIGTLSFGTSTRASFVPDELDLMRSVANQVSTGMQRLLAARALEAVNAELCEADKRKNEFLAVLSHELRNPLAPIKNSLYVMKRAAPGGDQAQRAQAVIDRQVNQLVRLVDDLLDVTRISRNKIQLQRHTVELNDLVRRTIEDHGSAFEKSGVHLRAQLATEPVHLLADGERLSQVVGNLLQNAVKFTANGGSVTVSVATDRANRQAILRVADTGVGMRPETLTRLFEPFMQADQTLDRSRGGLGLGLALVKGLVELHGGVVSAHSDGLGKGALFTIRLPLEPSAAVEAPSAPAKHSHKGRRVLVIEDNHDAAESLREALGFGCHDVAIAHNGPEGIARARSFRPQVVLCDIGLPGMDGYQVARILRADHRFADVFLVALSGYALPEDLQRAADAGFERHLSKPANMEQLQQLLDDLPVSRTPSAGSSVTLPIASLGSATKMPAPGSSA